MVMRVIVHIDLKGLPLAPEYLCARFAELRAAGATGILLEWEDMMPWSGELSVLACPHAFTVDLDRPDAKDILELLHLHHEHPVHRTCAWWIKQLPDAPLSWDDGLDGGELCHRLFGVQDDQVHGDRCVRFRCGPRRDSSRKRLSFAHHSYCHTS